MSTKVCRCEPHPSYHVVSSYSHSVPRRRWLFHSIIMQTGVGRGAHAFAVQSFMQCRARVACWTGAWRITSRRRIRNTNLPRTSVPAAATPRNKRIRHYRVSQKSRSPLIFTITLKNVKWTLTY